VALAVLHRRDEGKRSAQRANYRIDGYNMKFQQYLTLKNLLIAVVLIVSYSAILRWCENGMEPRGTCFSVLPPMCPESVPMPLAFLPLTAMIPIGCFGWLLISKSGSFVRRLSCSMRGGQTNG
jgi:hypothetical protein